MIAQCGRALAEQQAGRCSGLHARPSNTPAHQVAKAAGRRLHAACAGARLHQCEQQRRRASLQDSTRVACVGSSWHTGTPLHHNRCSRRVIAEVGSRRPVVEGSSCCRGLVSAACRSSPHLQNRLLVHADACQIGDGTHSRLLPRRTGGLRGQHQGGQRAQQAWLVVREAGQDRWGSAQQSSCVWSAGGGVGVLASGVGGWQHSKARQSAAAGWAASNLTGPAAMQAHNPRKARLRGQGRRRRCRSSCCSSHPACCSSKKTRKNTQIGEGVKRRQSRRLWALTLIMSTSKGTAPAATIWPPWSTSLLHDRLDKARAASWRQPSLLLGCGQVGRGKGGGKEPVGDQ